MHPLIARYLDLDTARETLQKEKAGEPLGPEEQLFLATASEHADKRAAVLGSKGTRSASSDAQAALLFLAAHTAARALGEDAELAAAAAKAREALGREGASPEETEAFIASILLEEAFGYEEEEVDRFDSAYVKEALGEVPALAALTRERVDALLTGFVEAGTTEKQKAVRERIAEALVELAWSEGPAPINPEHMEGLLESQLQDRTEEELEEGLRATVDFLQALAREGLIGPQRLSRLRAVLGDEDA
jgi:hypothetical protein